MKGHSIIWIVMAASTMLVSMLALVPEHAKASTTSTVALTLQDSPLKADVSPHNTGIVTINGQIKCTVNGTAPMRVFLQAQSNTGGTSVTSPSRIFNGSDGLQYTENFTVTTRVPQGYTSIETPKVTVSGYFIQGGLQYEIPPVSQIIEIEPYYRFDVDTPPPQEIGAGEFVYFTIKITNMGNAEDTYEFILMNCEELCDEQWVIATITPKTFMVGETKTVTVSAQAPQTWTLWKNKVTPIKLRILSQQSADEGGNVRYDLTLLVRQKGSYIPGFDTTFAFLGVVLVALVMGRGRLSNRKPTNFPCGQSKDLYGKLSMNMR